jgi:hypothetical protein
MIKQRTLDGKTWIFRWYVFAVSGKRHVTWAPDEASARAKAAKRGIVVDRVEPAPAGGKWGT